MLKPAALRPGDKIALVSPASPFARDEFDRGVAALRSLGFEPVWEPSVFEQSGYVSGGADTRAAAILRAWRDPSIKALIAVRGGYGSVQLLPHLPASDLRRSPKAFVGYSDNTALLTWLTIGAGVVGFHGPMLEKRLSRGAEGFHRESFLGALTSNRPLGALEPEELVVLQDGEARGPVFGGNLVQLTASLGTPYAFNPPDGCVLFFEDVNERPYKLDRMLTQLRLAGVLGKARGLVFGEMRDCDEAGGRPSARETVKDVMAGFGGPILFGFPSGHTDGPCWTLPLGVTATVRGGSRPGLVIEESAVE